MHDPCSLIQPQLAQPSAIAKQSNAPSLRPHFPQAHQEYISGHLRPHHPQSGRSKLANPCQCRWVTSRKDGSVMSGQLWPGLVSWSSQENRSFHLAFSICQQMMQRQLETRVPQCAIVLGTGLTLLQIHTMCTYLGRANCADEKLKCSSKSLPPVSNEQFCPQKIRSKRECSLDTPFSARDNIAKWR